MYMHIYIYICIHTYMHVCMSGLAVEPEGAALAAEPVMFISMNIITTRL